MEPTPYVDHRRSQRVHEEIPMRFILASDDGRVQHEAFTTNLSLHGMGIRTAMQLFLGERILVLPRTDFRYRAPARVVWVQGMESGKECVGGLEFLNPFAA